MEFKIGDKVRAKGKVDGTALAGKAGKVISVKEGNDFPIAIEFDERISGGHTCGNRGKDGYCRWAKTEELKMFKARVSVTPSHLVVWDTGCGDPHKFFESEKEANAFVKDLSDKSDVIKDSIILVEVKSVKKVTIRKYLTSAQYKI